MRGLKPKQYEERFKQFKQGFKSDLPEGSSAYTNKLHTAYDESLERDGIVAPVRITHINNTRW